MHTKTYQMINSLTTSSSFHLRLFPFCHTHLIRISYPEQRHAFQTTAETIFKSKRTTYVYWQRRNWLYGKMRLRSKDIKTEWNDELHVRHKETSKWRVKNKGRKKSYTAKHMYTWLENVVESISTSSFVPKHSKQSAELNFEHEST